MRRTLISTLLAAGLIGAGSLALPVRAEPITATESSAPHRPDIVLILMDDFSLELLQSMPAALKMQSQGASYPNSFVVDSMCCPSRASVLTGRPPHLTGVLVNSATNRDRPMGGYAAFRRHGNDDRTFNLRLKQGGYRTGFIGKFLNGYEVRRRDGRRIPPPRVPGWSEFQAILGGGYRGWGFLSTYVERGELRLRRHAKPPAGASDARKDRRYATNVMARMAVSFIRTHRDDNAPYFLEISTYAPHAALSPAYRGDPLFPPAFRDRPGHDLPGGNCGTRRCGELSLDDLVGYDDPRRDNAPYYLRDGSVRPAPAWRTNEIRLSARRALRLYRDRTRMVQSIDRLVRRVRAEVGPNTYVVLTADNGYHLGQHQLNGGKGAPYDSDTRVPHVVVGPGVPPGTRSQFVSNLDLARTFEDLAGVDSPRSRAGRSFAASLRLPEASGNRYAFIEHTNLRTRSRDVDADAATNAGLWYIPSYVAVRSAEGLLVRVDLDYSRDGRRYAWELYRYDVPWEDRNVFAEHYAEPWVLDLRRRLRLFAGCRPAECRRAAR